MAALERMRPRDRGSVVNVGSALAFIGIPLQAAYCSSKFACRGFFESTRAELLHDGSNVRLSMVHLPAVNTPQFNWCQTTMDRHPQPVPPIYQPEIPAKAIVKVALDGRRSKVVGAWNKVLVAAGQVAPGSGQSLRRARSMGHAAHRPGDPGRSSGQPAGAGRRRRRCGRPRHLRRACGRLARPQLPQVAPRHGADLRAAAALADARDRARRITGHR